MSDCFQNLWDADAIHAVWRISGGFVLGIFAGIVLTAMLAALY